MIKKIVWMMALCLVGMSVKAQAPMPQWTIDLVNMNPDVIDSIHRVAIDYAKLQEAGVNPASIVSRTYVIYYHQPRKHSEPQGEQFPLRAMMTVYNDADPTTAMNQFYIGGYALPQWWREDPDLYFSLNAAAGGEIARRYHGNYIWPEYRYFQFSAPVQCYEKLEDMRSEEAAEDFHNLLTAMKKVLHGKWAVSGGSKGGEAALLQHAFHPEDADAFVPYVAPFFDNNCDTTMQHYWLNNGWNKDYLETFRDIQRTFIKRKEQIYPLFQKMSRYYGTTSEEKIYGNYLSRVAHFGFEEHAYSDTAVINDAIQFNGNIMYLNDIQGYNDSVYAIMLLDCSFKLKYFGERISVLRGQYQAPARGPQPKRVGAIPRGVTEAEWWNYGEIGKDEQGYQYQSKVELGYYDLRFNDIVGPDTAATLNADYKQYVGTLRDFDNPYYKDFPFDISLYNRAVTTTQNATKPIIFIYGEDDPWTGAAMKDEYINGTNVKKFILPGQNHGASFSSNTDIAKCDAIRAALDAVFGAPQSIENTPFPSGDGWGEAHKFLRDGQILILRGNKTYTITGAEVR